jgi:hypothetical protein
MDAFGRWLLLLIGSVCMTVSHHDHCYIGGKVRQGLAHPSGSWVD